MNNNELRENEIKNYASHYFDNEITIIINR